MKQDASIRTNFPKVAELVPLVLIALGLLFDWLNIPYGGLILILGFFLYGVFGVIISIQRKYYKGITIRLFKLVNDVAIVVLTVAYLMGIDTLLYLLMLVVLDRLFLIRRIDLKSSRVP